MDENSLQSRLSRISTMWTMLGRAGQSPGGETGDARLALFQRYQGAAYRYLLAAVRDPDAADELFQEFALRVVQGKFSRADPRRGRFRDYLKATLIHLVSDHRARQGRARRAIDAGAAQIPDRPAEPDRADAEFLESWRDELQARAWSALAAAQQHGGPPHHSVLKFRAEHPEASSAEMAAELGAQLRLERPLTEAGVRKMLQRAREHFAESLVDEVAYSLVQPTVDDLERELLDLGLLSYCRSALAPRRNRS